MNAVRRVAALALAPLLVLTLASTGAQAGGGPTEEDVREAYASIAGQDLVSCSHALVAESCDSTLLNINLDNRVFCQQLDDNDGRCEFYWPFINPTVHPELAPPSAFTYDPDLADRLRLEIAQRDDRLRQLDSRVTDLDSRLTKAKARIKKLRKLLQAAQQS